MGPQNKIHATGGKAATLSYMLDGNMLTFYPEMIAFYMDYYPGAFSHLFFAEVS